MFKFNQLMEVKDSSLHFQGQRGYFQFMGGPDEDVVVLIHEDDIGKTGQRYIAVGLDDVKPILEFQMNF